MGRDMKKPRQIKEVQPDSYSFEARMGKEEEREREGIS
jgi:hypothetical protein